MMPTHIDICAFDATGAGVDVGPEQQVFYDTPRAAREASQNLFRRAPEVHKIWIRRINAGHLRTIAMLTRDVVRVPGVSAE